MALVDFLDFWRVHLQVVNFLINFFLKLDSLFVFDLTVLKHFIDVLIPVH